MISEPRSVGAANQLLQAAEMLTGQRLSRAKVHGDAVLHYAITFQDLIQNMQRPAALYHEVFRDDFKPVDNRLLFQNMIVMRDAQPDAYAVVLMSIETICGHKTYVIDREG